MKKNLWIIVFIAIIGFYFAACDSSTLRSLTHQNHNWSGWRTTTAPTCTAAGEETRTCSECGTTQSRTLPEKGHNWGNWVVTVFGPTKTCSRCGNSNQIEVVYFLGKWQNYSISSIIDISENEFFLSYENSSFSMSDLTWTAIIRDDSAGFEISGKITFNHWFYNYIFPSVPSIGGTYTVSVYFSNDGIWNGIRVPEFTGTFLK